VSFSILENMMMMNERKKKQKGKTIVENLKQ